VPLTLEGRATCMIKNVLPAILAASLSNFDIKGIRRSLQSFIPGPQLTPGRMNIFKIRNFEVMIDYVHNTDGFKQLKEFMQQINAEVKVGIIGCAGDRRDKDIREMGKYAAEIFDEFIIRHDKDGRGRTNEEITTMIMEGIHSVKPGATATIISDEIEALAYAIKHAAANSFIVTCSDDTKATLEYMTSYMERKESFTLHEV